MSSESDQLNMNDTHSQTNLDNSTIPDNNEEHEKNDDESLTEAELEAIVSEAESLKSIGNEQFKNKEYQKAIETYTQSMSSLPKDHKLRAILYCNRAACHVCLESWQSAVEDANEALKIDPNYSKALHRRAIANEKLGNLSESIEDYKKVNELEPNMRLGPTIERLEKENKIKQEKETEEMLGQLKDLGNKFLGMFGLSIDNFKAEKDESTGSYKINFQK